MIADGETPAKVTRRVKKTDDAINYTKSYYTDSHEDLTTKLDLRTRYSLFYFNFLYWQAAKIL